jgi:hypothetical protein
MAMTNARRRRRRRGTTTRQVGKLAGIIGLPVMPYSFSGFESQCSTGSYCECAALTGFLVYQDAQ